MNVYLEKIALTLDVDGKGKVTSFHEAGSTLDQRASKARLINEPRFSKATIHAAKRSGKYFAAGAVGAGALYGASKLIQRSMQKSAMENETKKELANSALIGAVGVGTGFLAHKIGGKLGKPFADSAVKMGLLSGGLGLAGDYAAVKANKVLNNKADTYLNGKNPEGIK